MTAPVFVDTNVLVYRHDSSDPAKQSRANDWITLLVRRRLARISFQVLQELYATLTRKLKPDFDTREAQEIVRDLAVWRPVAVDLTTMERSWAPAATLFSFVVGRAHRRGRANLRMLRASH